jgi:high-affinity iron transporter
LGVLLVTGVAAALVLGRDGGGGSGRIVASSSHCGFHWKAPPSGRTVFTVANTTPDTVYSVVLVSSDQSRIFGQIKTLDPGTELPLDVVLPPGEYAFVCAAQTGYSLVSPTREVRGEPVSDAQPYTPVTQQQMRLAALDYEASLLPVMRRLARDTHRLAEAVAAGRLDEARRLWVPAHVDYAQLGAAYDAFGPFNDRINQQPFGLVGGVDNPGFRGFHRLEYGLWHGQSSETLTPVARALDRSVHQLLERFPRMGIAPATLSLRAHEILENTLQFEMTGASDHGSHTNLATAWANVQGTDLAMSALHPVLSRANPELAKETSSGLDRLGGMLASHRSPDGSWDALDSLTEVERTRINGTLSGLLEQLQLVPDQLQPAPSGGDVD